MAQNYAFTSSLTAMRAQSQALAQIGTNVTNVSTAGYKKSTVEFSSLVNSFDTGSTFENYSGVRPKIKREFDAAGQLATTNRNLDAAMLGNGFFITSSTASNSGNLSLTKAGQFNTSIDPTAAAGETYITDATGHYLLGWPYNTTTNSFTTGTTTGSLQPIRVDANGNTYAAVATTTGSINANLPSNDAVGATRTVSVPIVDGTGDADNVSDDRAINVTWTKTANNTWDVSFAVQGGTVASPATAQQMTFDNAGLNPNFTASNTASQAVTVNWASPAGTSNTVNINLAAMTQFAADQVDIRDVSSNGNRDGSLKSIAFQNGGVLMGEFSNGQLRPIAKIAAATVQNSNGLNPVGDTHFELTSDSGAMTLRQPDQTDLVNFVAGGYEASSTDLNEEVSKMIQTQRAYSTAATSLKTVDEMTKTASELK